MQPASPISIELVKAKFDEWRATRKTKTSKIPEILWDVVKPLYPHYSLAQISTTLGLSYPQLKSQLPIPTYKLQRSLKQIHLCSVKVIHCLRTYLYPRQNFNRL